MIKTSRQLKDLIRNLFRNLSRQKEADAQTLLRNYMMERFLERVAASDYREYFILKGGMLVAAMVGLDARSTMDLDATIRGKTVNTNEVKKIVSDIITAPIGDEVTFAIKDVSGIMDEAEYPGVRVSMEDLFDGVKTPLKIDISTGDAITPQAIEYQFPLMFEKRVIKVLAYNLETVIAEKLETVYSRSTLNTRMRDFYDLSVLSQMYGSSLKPSVLSAALSATAQRRGHASQLVSVERTLQAVENSDEMRKLWKAYQTKFSYANSITWATAIHAVRKLSILAGLKVERSSLVAILQAPTAHEQAPTKRQAISAKSNELER